MKNKVLVVDFGSQYNMLIVRKVRELKVNAELVQVDYVNKLIETGEIKNYGALILSGGPNIVTDEGALKIGESVFDMDIPILGICYGMQLISSFYGSELKESIIKEYGSQKIKIDSHSDVFKNCENVEDVWMSHGYEVTNCGDEIEVLAYSVDNVVAGIRVKNKKTYGVQFHLEVTDTINGKLMLDNFLSITGVSRNYTMENFLKQEIKKVKQIVGENTVICGLSGGVDSTVVAALLNKAIGSQVKCILVDHGLLRKNEVSLVVDFLAKQGIKVNVVDAKREFLDNLKGVIDPESKRKIIGKLFIDIFAREASKFENAKFLAQGTLYTDVIESGTSTAHTIKSHHNVGGLPKDLNFELIEPLNKLFKDEVRILGLELGLSKEIVNRQPFPGPGLAIRIMGEVTEEKIEVVKESDYIFRTMLDEKNLSKDIWQSFSVLTNTKTVGVKGDERSYEYVLALRAIDSIDGMTARASLIPVQDIVDISTQITNKVRKINRVVYDVTNKPPSTIEWE